MVEYHCDVCNAVVNTVLPMFETTVETYAGDQVEMQVQVRVGRSDGKENACLCKRCVAEVIRCGKEVFDDSSGSG